MLESLQDFAAASAIAGRPAERQRSLCRVLVVAACLEDAQGALEKAARRRVTPVPREALRAGRRSQEGAARRPSLS